MENIINTILDISTYAATGAAVSWFYFYKKRRALLGGFWGGAVIGVVGAVIISWITGTWFVELMSWMMNPKKIAGGIFLRVNMIAAIFGAIAFVYILNRINNDKERG